MNKINKIHQIYQDELYKIEELSYENINFINNIMEIKNKINILTYKLNRKLQKTIKMENELLKIKKLESLYNSLNILYSEIDDPSNLLNFLKNLISANNFIKLKLEKIKLIHKKIDELCKILKKRTILKNIISKIENIDHKPKVICTICCENNVQYCINPCGHLFCNDCSLKILNNKCHICRTYVISQIKIYGI